MHCLSNCVADWKMKETGRKYGILEKDMKAIISILSTNIKVEKIVLFGSRAKGNFQPGSDIDVALKGEGLNLDDLLEAGGKYDSLLLPFKLDLVIHSRISENLLLDHIERVGIVLFERE